MSPIRVLHFFDNSEKWNSHYMDRLREAEARFAAKASPGSKPGEGLIQLRERARMIEDPGAYLDFFRRRWSGQKVFCDVTPAYYHLDREAFARMHAHHPSVKMFFVMRNPIDRFWSEIRMNLMYDPQFDALGSLDSVLRSKSAWPGGYIHTIENLEAAVPAGDFRVLFFEDLFKPGTIEDFCRFLGIAPIPAEIGTAMNQAESIPLDEARRGALYRRFAPVFRFVHERYRGKIPQSWLDDMERFGSVREGTVDARG